MSHRHSRGFALLACVLSVAWLIGTTVVANAAPATLGAWNLKLIGTVDTATGPGTAKGEYSKISPWPTTDGNYLYVGCYESLIDPAMPGCFRVVDVKEPRHPKRIATVEVYDRVKSPLPPLQSDPFWATFPHGNVWTDPKFNDTLSFSTACGDWIKGEDGKYAAETTGPTCWDKGWITRTHYTAYASGEYADPDFGDDHHKGDDHYGVGGDWGDGKKDRDNDGRLEVRQILWVNSQRQGGAPANRLGYTGIGLYDMKNPAKPKFLSRIDFPVRTLSNGNYSEAGGVHHGFFDGRYAYLGGEWGGYWGKILIIVDTKDPKNPVVAGTWHLPGQKMGDEDALRDWTQQNSFSSPIAPDLNPANPRPRLFRHVGMHYISVNHIRGKEIAFLSYHQAGLVILDVTDKKNPKFISRLDYLSPTFQASEPQNGQPSPDYAVCNRADQTPPTYPKGCGNAHSGKLVPGTNAKIYWQTDEYFNRPFGHLRLIDVSDLKNPKIISHYVYPENLNANGQGPGTEYPSRGPSAHLGNAYNKNLLFLGWYGLGLRVFDISHPKYPVEVGYYSYAIDDGVGGQGTYDAIFDSKGNVVITDEGDGVRILKYTGPGSPLKGNGDDDHHWKDHED